MNDIKSKVDFMNQVSEGQDTDWLEEAMWRKQNAAWLKKSMDIANDVLDELHRQKMSKSDFAKAMGVTPQRVSTLLSGREKMNLETISKMEEALHITLVQTGEDKNAILTSDQTISIHCSFTHEYATEFPGNINNIIAHNEHGTIETILN